MFSFHRVLYSARHTKKNLNLILLEQKEQKEPQSDVFVQDLRYATKSTYRSVNRVFVITHFIKKIKK